MIYEVWRKIWATVCNVTNHLRFFNKERVPPFEILTFTSVRFQQLEHRFSVHRSGNFGVADVKKSWRQVNVQDYVLYPTT